MFTTELEYISASPTVGHRRSLSTDEDLSLDGRKRHRSRSSPSEKARLHFHFRTHLSAMSVGKEMSLGDPHYRPRTNEQNLNPFATLPRLALTVRNIRVLLN